MRCCNLRLWPISAAIAEGVQISPLPGNSSLAAAAGRRYRIELLGRTCVTLATYDEDDGGNEVDACESQGHSAEFNESVSRLLSEPKYAPIARYIEISSRSRKDSEGKFALVIARPAWRSFLQAGVRSRLEGFASVSALGGRSSDERKRLTLSRPSEITASAAPASPTILKTAGAF